MLVVAVVAVAYGTAAPQLAVAEFAPSAQRAIEAPPTTTGPDAGTGARSGGRRATTTTAPATAATATTAPAATGGAPTTRVARSRACVGNPPRQTEDPMSPACLAAIFEGANGGATHGGVSATEIRIGVPTRSTGPDDQSAIGRTIRALFDYFNNRYEFYGRRLVPVLQQGDTQSPVNARALGQQLASSGIFGAITADVDWGSPQASLVHGLAFSDVVTVVRNAATWWSDAAVFDELHPLVWSVFPSFEDIEANVGDFSCSSLAGRPARFARDGSVAGTTRRFGIIAATDQQPPSPRRLADRLSDCTGAPTLQAQWTSSEGTPALRTALTRLRDGGMTSLICVCGGINPPYYVLQQLTELGYGGEIILNPTAFGGSNDDERLVQQMSVGLSAPLRISAGPRLLPVQARPWYSALQSTGADLLQSPSDAYFVWGVGAQVYEQLLVLASGIQSAGPTLTPDTFAAGLMSTQFPNPGAGQPPYWQPSAGFGPGDHSLYDDYSVAWWSDAVEAVNYGAGSIRANGSWCYVGQGQRFHPGAYPSDDSLLFNASLPCR